MTVLVSAGLLWWPAAFAQEPPIASSQQPPLAAPASIPPTAQTITLALRNQDIVEAFKLLSQQAGLNLVISPSVQGTVTLFLKDVNAWDAFLIILESNNLAYEQEGAIVKVITEQEYERRYGRPFQDKRQLQLLPLRFARASLVTQALGQLKTSMGSIVVDNVSNTIIIMDTPPAIEAMRRVVAQLDAATQTKVFTLRYAKALEMEPRLIGAVTQGIGQMDVDERTNKIIATDLPERLEEMERLITAFDEPTKQVLIDAKIVQVTLADDDRVGVDWAALFKRLQDRPREEYRVLDGGWPDTSESLKLATAPREQLDAVLLALESVGRLNVVASPRLAVLDNQEASLNVGTREAYITTNQQSGEQVSFVDVGVKLAVTPSIKAEGLIGLRIRPEISQVDRQLESDQHLIPILRLTEAQTSLLVKDGMTVLIAGLIDARRDGATANVVSSSEQKMETVIFLTPHIIRGDEAMVANLQGVPPPAPPASSAAPEPQAMALAVEAAPSAGTLPASYEIGVREQIQRQIVRQLHDVPLTAGRVEIFFVLGADGSLREAAKPDAYRAQAPLKALALQALRDAEPFASFPDGTGLEQATFHLAIAAGELH